MAQGKLNKDLAIFLQFLYSRGHLCFDPLLFHTDFSLSYYVRQLFISSVILYFNMCHIILVSLTRSNTALKRWPGESRQAWLVRDPISNKRRIEKGVSRWVDFFLRTNFKLIPVEKWVVRYLRLM